jgi:hypothetical protein
MSKLLSMAINEVASQGLQAALHNVRHGVLFTEKVTARSIASCGHSVSDRRGAES